MILIWEWVDSYSIHNMKWQYELVSSLSRHLWNGLRGWRWEAYVQGQLPLHVSGEECQRYKQCSSIPSPCPGGSHPVHLSAPVILFQCLCLLWWGETGHHEGKVLLQLLLNYDRPNTIMPAFEVVSNHTAQEIIFGFEDCCAHSSKLCQCFKRIVMI